MARMTKVLTKKYYYGTEGELKTINIFYGRKKMRTISYFYNEEKLKIKTKDDAGIVETYRYGKWRYDDDKDIDTKIIGYRYTQNQNIVHDVYQYTPNFHEDIPKDRRTLISRIQRYVYNPSINKFILVREIRYLYDDELIVKSIQTFNKKQELIESRDYEYDDIKGNCSKVTIKSSTEGNFTKVYEFDKSGKLMLSMYIPEKKYFKEWTYDHTGLCLETKDSEGVEEYIDWGTSYRPEPYPLERKITVLKNGNIVKDCDYSYYKDGKLFQTINRKY